MPFVADVFQELPALKNMIRYISKKPCFRGPFNTQHGESAETLLQSEWQHLYNIY